MNNNAWFKKENPLLSLQGMSGGAAGSLMQGAATKTYVDEVFSNTPWVGNMTDRDINTGLDMSGEGGLAWLYDRSGGTGGWLFDTVRGYNKFIRSSDNATESTEATMVSGFNSTGFSLDADGAQSDNTNYNGREYISWNFRKKEGFCDIVTYTGDGVNGRTVSHSLGSVPGMIIIKNLSDTDSWVVYHRDVGNTKALRLDTTAVAQASANWWYNTTPTSTEFTLGYGGEVNGNGYNYVAYVFAGGKGTTDKAVDFDGDDYLTMPVSNTDFDWGASDSLTIECFLNLDDVSSMAYNSIINRWAGSNYSFGLDVKNNGNLFFYFGSGTGSITTAESSGTTISTNTWYHVAVVKDGTTGRFFIDGKACGTFTWNLASSNSSQTLHVGNLGDGNSYDIDGELSNVRMTMGQALYTTNFNVPSDPLTTTSQGAIATNVKLLCCNQATTTGSTVAPGTITANGDPTVTTNSSIFDDTSAYVFGADEDKSIIQCGSYIGNGSLSNPPKINLGFEPQWLLFKDVSASSDWQIYDSMRQMTGDDVNGNLRLRPNTVNGEGSYAKFPLTTSTGFNSGSEQWSPINGDGNTTIYMAIRRTDGYVGKPAESGTDAFAMDVADSTSPAFDSGFPIDFALVRNPSGTAHWDVGARLIQGKNLRTNQDAAETSYSSNMFDYSGSWLDNTSYNGNQSWMWKRGQGFDMVTYEGNADSGRQISHNLSKTPEMMWFKNRTSAREWVVYHKDLNGGTTPQNYHLHLEQNVAEVARLSQFNNTAPTSTHFTIGDDGDLNNSGDNIIAMLFSSVTGISKVGSYTGTDSNPGPTITTGFQPRFIMIKCRNQTGNWVVLDSLRTFDNYSWLNLTNAQSNSLDILDVSSTGFTIKAAYTDTNVYEYIYYAHA